MICYVHFLEYCVAKIADLIGSVSISAPKINPLNAAEAVLWLFQKLSFRQEFGHQIFFRL